MRRCQATGRSWSAKRCNRQPCSLRRGFSPDDVIGGVDGAVVVEIAGQDCGGFVTSVVAESLRGSLFASHRRNHVDQFFR